ncbi:MAG: response regulator [Gaiellaceae bacterium]
MNEIGVDREPGEETRPLKILIAEDATITRLDLRRLLEQSGHEVYEARDGVEAVELAREFRPDLAILDVAMPRLDGIEAARRIRAERPIPIVALTAFSARKIVADAVDAGIFAYVVKPFSSRDLLPAIDLAFARHRELLEARRELGRRPPAGGPLDIVISGSAGDRWPLRIVRDAAGSLDIEALPDQPA